MAHSYEINGLMYNLWNNYLSMNKKNIKNKNKKELVDVQMFI